MKLIKVNLKCVDCTVILVFSAFSSTTPILFSSYIIFSLPFPLFGNISTFCKRLNDSHQNSRDDNRYDQDNIVKYCCCLCEQEKKVHFEESVAGKKNNCWKKNMCQTNRIISNWIKSPRLKNFPGRI